MTVRVDIYPLLHTFFRIEHSERGFGGFYLCSDFLGSTNALTNANTDSMLLQNIREDSGLLHAGESFGGINFESVRLFLASRNGLAIDKLEQMELKSVITFLANRKVSERKHTLLD